MQYSHFNRYEVASQNNTPMPMLPAIPTNNYTYETKPMKWVQPKFEMRINHPFLCIIYEKQSKVFVFVGKIFNPSQ